MKKAIAVYTICNTAGIEITDILYGINDGIEYRYTSYTDDESPYFNRLHKARIQETAKGRIFFKASNGMRVYLDECMRV